MWIEVLPSGFMFRPTVCGPRWKIVLDEDDCWYLTLYSRGGKNYQKLWRSVKPARCSFKIKIIESAGVPTTTYDNHKTLVSGVILKIQIVSGKMDLADQRYSVTSKRPLVERVGAM